MDESTTGKMSHGTPTGALEDLITDITFSDISEDTEKDEVESNDSSSGEESEAVSGNSGDKSHQE